MGVRETYQLPILYLSYPNEHRTQREAMRPKLLKIRDRRQAGLPVEGGHRPTHKTFSPKICLDYKMSGDNDGAETGGMASQLVTQLDSSHGQKLTPDIINDVLLCLQTGV